MVPIFYLAFIREEDKGMARTITVKGTGSTSVKPDYVVLNMTLESNDMVYKKAMVMASKHIAELTDALCAAGFAKEDLKTTDFRVDTDYDRIKNEDGSYRSVFNGYEVRHHLKLGFDFDTDRLSDALSEIAGCRAFPKVDISFTVKEPAKVSEELLCSATDNARGKAEVICRASGVGLGQLVRIDYNWGELDIYSHTRLNSNNYCLAAGVSDDAGIDFEPEDIKVGDTVTFEWEIM